MDNLSNQAEYNECGNKEGYRGHVCQDWGNNSHDGRHDPAFLCVEGCCQWFSSNQESDNVPNNPLGNTLYGDKWFAVLLLVSTHDAQAQYEHTG